MEAGYEDGLAVTLSTPDGAYYYQDVAITRSVAEQWGEIGVQARIEAIEWSLYVYEPGSN